jgi:hypothetical protein
MSGVSGPVIAASATWVAAEMGVQTYFPSTSQNLYALKAGGAAAMIGVLLRGLTLKNWMIGGAGQTTGGWNGWVVADLP